MSVHLPKSKVTRGNSRRSEYSPSVLTVIRMCYLKKACTRQNVLLYFETYGLFPLPSYSQSVKPLMVILDVVFKQGLTCFK